MTWEWVVLIVAVMVFICLMNYLDVKRKGK